MNLTELLDATARDYLDDRTALAEGDADELWSDEFLVRQFNQAQRILARRAWCIIETGVAPAGVITLIAGQAVYDLDKSVLRVYYAIPSDRTKPLYRTSDAALRGVEFPVDAPFDLNSTAEETGRPIAIATDAGTRQVRVFRTPTATEVAAGLKLNLKIARYPREWLTLEKPEGCPEVPEEYHDLLCKYAAGRALTLPNVDGQHRTIGRDFLNEFNEAVKEARQDRQRAEMEPARWGFASSTALLDS